MDIEAVLQGLSDAADTIAGLRCFPSLPGDINPPTFAPVEFELAYHRTFRGLGLSEVTVACGVYASDSDAGRRLLNGLLAEAGAGSVPAVLEADKTLAGRCKALIVERVRGVGRLYRIGAVDYLGAMLDVKVWA